MILRYIAGPLIGSVIGYFTNYIAVKMLFYPRNEIRLFGHRLPLTPGAIPKGKSRLAKAIGAAVGEQLLTGDDIQGRLLRPEVKDKVAEGILLETEKSLQEIGTSFATEEAFAGLLEIICAKVSDEIYASIEKLPIADTVIEKGVAIIKARTAGTMLQMFMSDEMINSFAGPVGQEIESYICENGRSYIQQEVSEKCSALVLQPVQTLLNQAEPDREKQKELIGKVYSTLVETGMTRVVNELNIAGMVEEKINAMAIDDLENLVMTVMKKELNTIVNLGALIGFVLGLINLLF